MPRGLQVIQRSVGGDASRPRSEASGGVEAGVRPIDALEGFDGEFFGDRWIADNTNDPAVDLGLVLME
jgi:hypothetical protein